MSQQDDVLERLLRDALEENAAFAPAADLTGPVVRRGRRARTRRRAGAAVLGAAAVATGIALAVTLPSGGPQGNQRITVQPTSPAPSPTPRLVRYPGDGVTVTGQADADRLQGTSQAFRDFVVGHVPKGTSCSGGTGSIIVKSWSSAGFAVGSVYDCPGGSEAIWGAPDGHWRQLVASQALWSCKALHKWSVPSSIAGDKCDGPAGTQPYHQR